MSKELQQQWIDLWAHLGVKEALVHEAYIDLVLRYAEPHRAYHTLDHIQLCLGLFERARHLAHDPGSIELAIWYHDAIYDTKAQDNEERSAALAVRSVKEALLPSNLGNTVAKLILATKHIAVSSDLDTQILVDIDISIFGQTEDVYALYERQIRKEYEWVPQEVFAAKRPSILQSFLDRPFIYETSFFRDLYESQARMNLGRSIGYLLS